MSSRHLIARESELVEDGDRVIEEVDGQEIAVFRHGGEYHAVANYCIHQAGPLCEGGLTGAHSLADDGWDWEYDPEERYVACPWHGWLFDITTGRNPKDDRYAVPTYDVEVEAGAIYVIR